jgi:hypothetical protein
MSIEAICKTQFSDKDALVEALSEIYGSNLITVKEQGIKVSGYRSAKTPSIIIGLPKMYGTAGYCLGPDGNYELVYDSTDKRVLHEVIPQRDKKTGAVTDRLTKTYAKIKTIKMIKQLSGYVTESEEDSNGTIRIRARIHNY